MRKHPPDHPHSLRSFTWLAALALAASATAVLAANASPDHLPHPLHGLRAQLDDAVVAAQVQSALQSHKATQHCNIKVTTRQGVVQLSGFVYNQAQSDAVLEVARQVKGVKAVENRLAPKVAPMLLSQLSP